MSRRVKPIESSPSLEAACARFLDEIGDWVRQCVDELADAPALDSHDQGTFTTAWASYIRARDGGRALRFATRLRDAARDHFVAQGRWHHGYWTVADVHHGTEHFQLFLGALLRLAPDDGETAAQLADAAEHLGNWVAGVPPWFDWEQGLFRALKFGTRAVEEGRPRVNLAPHFRCVGIALLAHDATGEPRYLELAERHAARWADALLADRELPAGIGPDGPLYRLEGETAREYHAFAGQAPKLVAAVDRAENLLASDAVGCLLTLWERTEDSRFRLAAERILDVLATQLGDPDAGPAADALRAYRRVTCDDRYDGAVLDALRALEPFGFAQLAIETEPQREARPPGIGKRRDMPAWFEDGQPRRRNPILLAAAAEIAGHEPLAARAVDLARAYLALARQCYPHGREHGCSARSVSAVARGHGRDNGAGVVTAVLEPLLTSFGLFESI
ncbi:MAG: hypothetical protein ACLF0G_07830 [Candidatus Brocadiia bacterium]